MLTPTVASVALLCVCVLLLIVVPIMDGSEKLSKFISLRYILVAMSLIMALGCILDFSHLAEMSRNIVLMGALILVGIFVVVRSLEKFKLGGKTIKLSIEKDGVKASATMQGEKSRDELKHVSQKERKIICENCCENSNCTEDNRNEEDAV